MKLLFILLFFLPSAYALEAVVTVLETPLLKFASLDAPVIGYLRKGQTIKIDPALNNIKTEGETGTDDFKDPRFISTLDRLGSEVYVIADHLFIYFNDKREIGQNTINPDPTDYRLEEPLPKNYPLPITTGYKGQILIGMGQPHTEAYPYPAKIQAKGFNRPIDLIGVALKQAPGNYDQRLFIGGQIHYQNFSNTFSFANGVSAQENYDRIGIGPTISYDAFKGDLQRLNISGTILFNFIDQLSLTQKSQNLKETKNFKSLSLTPKVDVQYQFKNALNEMDLILGTTLEVGIPKIYETSDSAIDSSLWRKVKEENFTYSLVINLGLYLGLQMAY